ncbi:hypothetical protein KNSL1_000173 [Colletotrichum chrysophilum]|nr:hypothetical protein KNSL1_000173 [Colletotrichum chrysophilum]
MLNVDSQTMGHLLDFFYRGNTPWKCPDDMLMLAKLWILADRLQATSAMIEVEHRVKSKLNGLSNKFIVADCTLLDTVFHHKACAESGLGYAVGEAACAILIDRSQYPKKSDLVEKHARENILSANMMLSWASRYKENSDEFEFIYRSSTVMKQRIDREEEFRDKLISEKMTKPSRILTRYCSHAVQDMRATLTFCSGPDATTSKKRKQSS